jgi:hypothetical protein
LGERLAEVFNEADIAIKISEVRLCETKVLKHQRMGLTLLQPGSKFLLIPPFGIARQIEPILSIRCPVAVSNISVLLEFRWMWGSWQIVQGKSSSPLPVS